MTSALEFPQRPSGETSKAQMHVKEQCKRRTNQVHENFCLEKIVECNFGIVGQTSLQSKQVYVK
jgi:hypothetical protein